MTFIVQFPGYYFDKKRLFSKTGREIRLCLKGYTKGYWLNGKFVTLKKLKDCDFIKTIEIPF